jgi:hypothetical protein
VSPIVFGEVIPCPDCGGTAKAPLSDEEKRERERVLRASRRRHEDPPPLVHSECRTCRGTGVLHEKGKYK